MDALDETGEDARDDSSISKKMIGVLIAVAVVIVIAVIVIAAFVFPGFAVSDDGSSDNPSQSQSTQASTQSDQSGRYRVGDTLRVVAGGYLTNVRIVKFTPEGALAEDDSHTQYAISQNQLDRYAKENPTMFQDRIAKPDEGKIKPQLEPQP